MKTKFFKIKSYQLIKPVFYIVFLFGFLPLKAQENLVRNGSFEEYWECPDGNDLNDGQLEKCKYWWKPTGGTSDYFNRCNNLNVFNNVVGVPTNFWGHQEAFDGDGYVGLGLIDWQKSTGITLSTEYVQTELKFPLKKCHLYELSFFINLADFSFISHGYMGAILTEDTLFNVNLDQTMIQPNGTYINFGPEFLNDSLKWVELKTTFVAKGGERFLTLGLFDSIVKLQYHFIQTSAAFPDYNTSYYLIDEVSLVEIPTNFENCIESLSLPNVITPNQDGVNDFFTIQNELEWIEEISIVNRWGNEMVKLNKENPIWQPVDESDGVYFYIVRFKEIYKKEQKTGFIQLVR